MRLTLLLVRLAGFVGLATLLALPACGDDSSPSGTQTVRDSGGSRPDGQSAPDSGPATDDTGDGATAASQVSFRIAHLSPDAPPFDVCLAPAGTTDFQGPFLHAFAVATATANGTPFPDDSGAATGLRYGQVSAYFLVGQGTYDVRLVAAGATSCDAALGGFPTSTSDAGADAAVVDGAGGATVADSFAEGSADDASDSGEASAPADDGSLDDASATIDATIAALEAGADAAASDAAVAVTTISSVAIDRTFTTLLVAGEVAPSGSDPALVVAPIGDDAVLVSGGATLRAVNALASGVTQDFGFESSDGGGFLSVFTSIGFATAAAHAAPSEGTLDGNGYLAVGEQDAVSFGARTSSGATADTAATQSLQIDLGAITTVVAIGGDAAGKQPAQLLFCVDNQPSGGALSDCAVLP